MLVLKVIFWISGLMIIYPYVGYIVLLWTISLFVSKINRESTALVLPKVTLLISAYNEEFVIKDKILNSLSLDYPKDLIEIVVVSDGSDDGTGSIVEQYEDQGVMLRHFEGRIGKTACLNKAVVLSKGEIVVFSDANSNYDKDAIKNLVRHFCDQKIGFVTGTTKYVTNSDENAIESVGLYSRIEKFTKMLESRIGSCVGADGAIFAVRKSLYQPLKDYDINDFVIPLSVVKQNHRGILESSAFCIEKTASDIRGEFSRQIRITNRTIRAIFNNASLLNPFCCGFFSLELLSHKVCKFLVPFFMLIMFFTNMMLISQGSLYVAVFIAQICFYLIAIINHSLHFLPVLSKLASASYTFTTVNLAILLGWVQYLKGETYTTWSPGQRGDIIQ
ncbi:glycosyltransferases [Candidatus Scalindua japonica]|uniref:Glycosyltransferases n=1 Tax=Candidatus Scalindua japonica TaxID=1284222 RepID=A0A286U4A5_9BACT|nr:glycosyltransferase family 2 protein [Candidatus Scalindua japonica]GAX62954.1 glycosyltransferases [Candidatus Scalindua japonica]